MAQLVGAYLSFLPCVFERLHLLRVGRSGRYILLSLEINIQEDCYYTGLVSSSSASFVLIKTLADVIILDADNGIDSCSLQVHLLLPSRCQPSQTAPGRGRGSMVLACFGRRRRKSQV
eukprot:TRINITY_DN4476_c0_g1_i4.p1 TRINITY_DN4476_c0_g1~~TRINITY_DN4476_c0_g1_i4.p1  ORF type:complete len:118 (-),score=3.32 TRINITY_DN4476_c0_g1_i4:834-1187(-)